MANNRTIIAHTSDKYNQPAHLHGEMTAKVAMKNLGGINLDALAMYASIVHDLGKYSTKWQKYINGDNKLRGIIHSFQGAKYVLERYHTDADADDYQRLTAEIIAYAVMSHHGLVDISNGDDDENGFAHRLNAKGLEYDECVSNFKRDNISIEAILDYVFGNAVSQVKDIVDKYATDSDEMFFQHMAIARLITSAVMNGDKTDTAKFCCGDDGAYSDFIKAKTLRVDTAWGDVLSRIDDKIDAFSSDTEINKARRYISDKCKEFSKHPDTLVKLKTPTGGGKTIASLRYAVSHAKEYGKDRIIFTIPLLSILEQNADVIKEFVGDDSIVLEHYGDMREENRTSSEDESVFDDALYENWDSPIIVTTMAQFLNTLFLGKSSSVRRFQSLVNSVVVIDEVQTVPIKMLGLFNSMVNFLTRVCNCTVVMCSATQPCLESVEHPLFKEPVSMVDVSVVENVFKRTDIQYDGLRELKDIPDYVSEITPSNNSTLIVCNTKKEAEYVFSKLKDIQGGDCEMFYLSASLCPSHRRNVISAMKQALASKDRKVICVSTQVIEAGVDVSFSTVVRFTAGLDNIVQSAGRCNRNGEIDGVAIVHVVTISDEDLKGLSDIIDAKNATIKVIEELVKNGVDFLDDRAITAYYNNLFDGRPNKFSEFVLPNGDTLYNLFGMNYNHRATNCGYIVQNAMKTAGSLFTVYGDDTVQILVPYYGGDVSYDFIDSMRSVNNYYDLKRLVSESKQYSCSVYSNQYKRLEDNGLLGYINLGDSKIAYLLHPENYDINTGVIVNLSVSAGYLSI